MFVELDCIPYVRTTKDLVAYHLTAEVEWVQMAESLG